jgi:hypothetical protein
MKFNRCLRGTHRNHLQGRSRALFAAWFMLVSSLVHSPILKMEDICPSETSVDFHRTIRRYTVFIIAAVRTSYPTFAVNGSLESKWHLLAIYPNYLGKKHLKTTFWSLFFKFLGRLYILFTHFYTINDSLTLYELKLTILGRNSKLSSLSRTTLSFTVPWIVPWLGVVLTSRICIPAISSQVLLTPLTSLVKNHGYEHIRSLLGNALIPAKNVTELGPLPHIYQR